MEMLGYGASIFMGLVLGMIGGGGSILTVPLLVYLFAINPVTATAYSLFIVGLTALIGGIGAAKKGMVDFKTGLLFAAPSFLSVYLTRAYLIPSMPENLFRLGSYQITKPLFMMIVFAILMLLASISMIKKKKTTEETGSSTSKSAATRYTFIALEGLLVGAVTGFVGAGGGFLIIPALVVLVGLPMKVAVGTSLFIIAIKSLIGFVGDLQSQTAMDWTLLLQVSGLAVLGILIGQKLSAKVPEAMLKKGFGYFVLMMGSVILLDQVTKI